MSDEEAIRLIEQHNPNLEFDWTRILKGEVARVGSIDEAEITQITVEPSGDGAPLAEAQTKLGPEGFARLRARYSELLARISEVIQEPVRRDELKSRAERLNPDTWVTEAEVAAGLETYESEFEALRSAVGARRRKRRRSRRRRPDQGPAPAEPALDESDDEDTPEPEAG